MTVKRKKYIEEEGATVNVEFSEQKEEGSFTVTFGAYLAASGTFTSTAGGVQLNIAPQGNSTERLLVTKVLGIAVNDGLFESEQVYRERVEALKKHEQKGPKSEKLVSETYGKRWRLVALVVTGLVALAEIIRSVM